LAALAVCVLSIFLNCFAHLSIASNCSLSLLFIIQAAPQAAAKGGSSPPKKKPARARKFDGEYKRGKTVS